MTDTIKVAASILPTGPSGTAVTGTASTPIPDIAVGATVDGQAATLGPGGNATVASSGAWPAGIALETLTGAVTTTAAVLPGTYSLAYMLCDRNTPPDCATRPTPSIVKSAAGGSLLIQKSGDKSQAEIGDSVQYRILVRNPGTAVVVEVKLNDSLPLGFGSSPVRCSSVATARCPRRRPTRRPRRGRR